MNLNLLKDVQKIINQNQEEINKTGKGFNLISILGMEEKETRTHSNLIAELLDSKGSHTYGNTFMKLFLEEMGISNFDTSNYSVIKEEFVGAIKCTDGESRRTFLDIVIKDHTSRKVVLIENKIWAEDQPYQIERYYEYYNKYIIKLFYLNVNEWFECPSKKPEVIQVFENISYKTQIKNWLANCITNSKEKPFVNNQIETYYQTVLKLTNQNIYKKMSVDIERKISENYENFQTAEEIANRFNNMKEEKLNSFYEKLKLEFKKVSSKYDDRNLIAQIKVEKGDYLFLGFYLQDSTINSEINFDDEVLKSKLETIFGNNMNANWVGWEMSIKNNEDLYKLCKDEELYFRNTVAKFNNTITNVESILNLEFRKI